jgi:magnesium chelatase family protein
MTHLAISYSYAVNGISAQKITIEAHLCNGLPSFNLVGLPEKVVKESKERVRSAIISNHFQFPARRITVNLAPAELPKNGGGFDLAIALGILAASKQIPSHALGDYAWLGELALTGHVRPVQALLPIAIAAKSKQQTLILPEANQAQASLIPGRFFTTRHLSQACAFLKKEIKLQSVPYRMPRIKKYDTNPLDDIQGQSIAKKALILAACGGHHLLLCGPPGAGKTMLAQCLQQLLPPLNTAQSEAVAAIQSLCNQGEIVQNWGLRPMQCPHHTASCAALVGGGNPPCPGAITLAHHGLLFLDELPEFSKRALDCLREPMETGLIHIARAKHQVCFPAQFQLVAAMNPCPCGYFGDKQRECICSHDSIKRYQARISGPLYDRIDIRIMMQRSSFLTKQQNTQANPQAAVQQGIKQQIERQGKQNTALSANEITKHISLTPALQQQLHKSCEAKHISWRKYHKILKIARTLADLEQQEQVQGEHLNQALFFNNAQ